MGSQSGVQGHGKARLIVAAAFIILLLLAATVSIVRSNPTPPAEAQGADWLALASSVSATITGPKTLTKGQSASYTINVSGIVTSPHVSYSGAVSASGGMSLHSNCRSGSKRFTPRRSSYKVFYVAYACEAPKGAVSVDIDVSTPDGDFNVASKSVSITVTVPPTATPRPTNTPTPTPTSTATPTPSPTPTVTPTPTPSPTPTPLPTPPAVTGVSVTASTPYGTTKRARVQWTYIPDAPTYRVERRVGNGGDWGSVQPLTGSGDHQASQVRRWGNVYPASCEGTNYFRVLAYGNGIKYRHAYGPPSVSRSISTAALGCHIPTPTPSPSPTPTSTPQPIVVSISRAGSSTITEGGDAIFALTASPKPPQSIDVSVSISQDGDFATAGTRNVKMDKSGRGSLYISTEDDAVDEPDGSVTATLQSGTGYQIDSRRHKAKVAVRDNDEPPPSEPSFGRIDIELWLEAGDGVREQLPEATGGHGKLTYSIEPRLSELDNGITFDSFRRTIVGKTIAAAKTSTHKYTVTDENDAKHQVNLTITVFAIELQVTIEQTGGGDISESLDEAILKGMLAYEVVILKDAVKRPETHLFRVSLPNQTGFQVNTRSCEWTASQSTAGLSRWLLSGETFTITRCALGSGTARATVWGKIGRNGVPYKIYETDVIPQAWHIQDNETRYYIRGSDADSSKKTVRGVEVGDQQGFFTETRPGSLPVDYVPNTELLQVTNYSEAAGAWNDLGAQIKLTRTTSADNNDMELFGYWNEDSGGDKYTLGSHSFDRIMVPYADSKCGDSIACVAYHNLESPHLGTNQVMWIEDPPHWGDLSYSSQWTTSMAKFRYKPHVFHYLPSVLMHEFGHGIALKHSTDGSSIMGHRIRELEPCVFGTRAKDDCGLTDTDKNGAEVLYENHDAH